MKQIVILFFTFSGICKGLAQRTTGNPVADTVKNITIDNQKLTGDSIGIKEKVSVKLYPNPVKNKVELEVSGFRPGQLQLQIIDINGKKLRDDQRLLVSGNENIVLMFSLPAGIYFILLKQKDKTVKKKMLVQ